MSVTGTETGGSPKLFWGVLFLGYFWTCFYAAELHMIWNCSEKNMFSTYIYKFAVYWAVHWQLSMVGVIFGTEGFCANLTDFSQKCEEKINEPTIKPLLTLGTPVISLWIHASEKSLCVILSRYRNSAVFKHDWISTVGKNAAFRFTGFSGTRGTLGQNSASLLTIPMH